MDSNGDHQSTAIVLRREDKKMAEQKLNLISFRCSPSHFLKFIKRLKLTDRHEQGIRNTPFGHILDLPYVHKRTTLLDDILGRFDHAKVGFMLGGICVPLQPLDVALIMGLNLRGREVDVTRNRKGDKGVIHQKYFGGKRIERSDIERVLSELVQSDLEGAIADVTSVFVLYVFCCLLFPDNTYSFPAPLISYVDDVAVLGSYAWANAVYSFLVGHLRKSAQAIQERNVDPSMSVGWMGGCTFLLNAWVFEHTTIWGEPLKDTFPRLFRWQDTHYSRKLTIVEKHDKLKTNEVIVCLTPDEQEYLLMRSPLDHPGPSCPAFYAPQFDTTTDVLLHNFKLLTQRLDEEIEERKKLQEEVELLRLEKGIVHMPSVIKGVKDKSRSKPLGPQNCSPLAAGKGKKRRKIGSPQKHGESVLENHGQHLVSLEYPAKGLLGEEDTSLVEAFLVLEMNGEYMWTCSSHHVTREELYTLVTEREVKDSVIIGYGHLLKNRGKHKLHGRHPICYYVNALAHEYFKKSQKGNFLKGINSKLLSEGKYIFIPLNEKNHQHWHLLVIDIPNREFLHLTSIKNPVYVAYCKQVVSGLVGHLKVRGCVDSDKWPVREIKTCPSQGPGVDCGVFVMKYMECLSRGKIDFDFDQNAIGYLRGKMAADFLRGFLN